MASTTETGHAKNVATFEDLISLCTTFGKSYNPSKAALKIDGLTAQLTEAQAALKALKIAKSTYDNATNVREVAFSPLKKLATKIVGALNATDALKQTVDDARTINNKIQGKRTGTIKKPNENALAEGAEPVKTSSTSQQSFDKIIDHYGQLLTLLELETEYAPNEKELKVATLTTMLTDLKTKNTAVLNSANSVSGTRMNRDKILYAPNTGMLDNVTAVKQYVKSLYGVNSPEFRKITSLKFSKGAGI